MSSRKKEYLSPLQSLDFYLPHYHALCKKLKLENDLAELRALLHRELHPSVVEILQNSRYEALVVTDSSKNIVWANNGFHEMTGYAKSFAIGKKPNFLQGVNTSETVREEIRQQLKAQIRFKASILNYRKNGEEYQCHIDVMPLFDSNKNLTHFLAMEREQRAA